MYVYVYVCVCVCQQDRQCRAPWAFDCDLVVYGFPLMFHSETLCVNKLVNICQDCIYLVQSLYLGIYVDYRNRRRQAMLYHTPTLEEYHSRVVR